MQTVNSHIRALIVKDLMGVISPGEADQLGVWLQDNRENRELFLIIADRRRLIQSQKGAYFASIREPQAFGKLQEHLDLIYRDTRVSVTHPIFRWSRIAAVAASVLVAASLLVVLIRYNQLRRYPAVTQQADILPGGNRAVLTLANGKKVILDSTIKGSIASSSGYTVVGRNANTLAYIPTNVQPSPAPTRNPTHIGYNSIQTPNGGQFRIILPDNTIVWMNAASSIKYPVPFSDSKREVELIGEAYFEVAPDKNRPFIVNVDSSRITVLGTKFDVKSYKEDRLIQAGLLEGSIAFEVNKKVQILKVGDELRMDSTGVRTTRRNEDLEDEIAWTRGYFEFNDAPIESVLGDIARWYNISVEIKTHISDTFTGEIPRNSRLTDVLSALKAGAKITFDLRGSHLIVH